MKTNYFIILAIAAVLVLALANGCAKSDAKQLTAEKIPAVMSEAFKQASGDTKAMAIECACACQTNDVTGAFKDLQRLSQSRELTPEQRAITAKAMVMTFQKLRSASESGDQAAQAVLHEYISTR